MRGESFKLYFLRVYFEGLGVDTFSIDAAFGSRTASKRLQPFAPVHDEAL